jgi:hypothetical protein
VQEVQKCALEEQEETHRQAMEVVANKAHELEVALKDSQWVVEAKATAFDEAKARADERQQAATEVQTGLEAMVEMKTQRLADTVVEWGQRVKDEKERHDKVAQEWREAQVEARMEFERRVTGEKERSKKAGDEWEAKVKTEQKKVEEEKVKHKETVAQWEERFAKATAAAKEDLAEEKHRHKSGVEKWKAECTRTAKRGIDLHSKLKEEKQRATVAADKFLEETRQHKQSVVENAKRLREVEGKAEEEKRKAERANEECRYKQERAREKAKDEARDRERRHASEVREWERRLDEQKEQQQKKVAELERKVAEIAEEREGGRRQHKTEVGEQKEAVEKWKAECTRTAKRGIDLHSKLKEEKQKATVLARELEQKATVVASELELKLEQVRAEARRSETRREHEKGENNMERERRARQEIEAAAAAAAAVAAMNVRIITIQQELHIEKQQHQAAIRAGHESVQAHEVEMCERAAKYQQEIEDMKRTAIEAAMWELETEKEKHDTNDRAQRCRRLVEVRATNTGGSIIAARSPEVIETNPFIRRDQNLRRRSETAFVGHDQHLRIAQAKANQRLVARRMTNLSAGTLATDSLQQLQQLHLRQNLSKREGDGAGSAVLGAPMNRADSALTADETEFDEGEFDEDRELQARRSVGTISQHEYEMTVQAAHFETDAPLFDTEARQLPSDYWLVTTHRAVGLPDCARVTQLLQQDPYVEATLVSTPGSSSHSTSGVAVCVSSGRCDALIEGGVNPVWEGSIPNNIIGLPVNRAQIPGSGGAGLPLLTSSPPQPAQLQVKLLNDTQSSSMHGFAIDDLLAEVTIDIELGGDNPGNNFDGGHRAWWPLEPVGKIELTVHHVCPIPFDTLTVGMRVKRGAGWRPGDETDGGMLRLQQRTSMEQSTTEEVDNDTKESIHSLFGPYQCGTVVQIKHSSFGKHSHASAPTLPPQSLSESAIATSSSVADVIVRWDADSTSTPPRRYPLEALSEAVHEKEYHHCGGSELGRETDAEVSVAVQMASVKKKNDHRLSELRRRSEKVLLGQQEDVLKQLEKKELLKLEKEEQMRVKKGAEREEITAKREKAEQNEAKKQQKRGKEEAETEAGNKSIDSKIGAAGLLENGLISKGEYEKLLMVEEHAAMLSAEIELFQQDGCGVEVNSTTQEQQVGAQDESQHNENTGTNSEEEDGDDDSILYSTFRRVSAAVVPANLAQFGFTNSDQTVPGDTVLSADTKELVVDHFERIPEGSVIVVSGVQGIELVGDGLSHGTGGLALSVGLASESAPFIVASLHRAPPNDQVATMSASTLPSSAKEATGLSQGDVEWSTAHQQNTMCLHCERHTHSLQVELRSFVNHSFTDFAMAAARRTSVFGLDTPPVPAASVLLGRATIVLRTRKRKLKRKMKQGRLQQQVRNLQRKLSSLGIDAGAATQGSGNNESAREEQVEDDNLSSSEDEDDHLEDEDESEDDSEDDDNPAVMYDGTKRWFPLDTGGQVRVSVQICMPVSAANVRLGLRVRRGPHWAKDNQDGGPDSLGTVVGYNSNQGSITSSFDGDGKGKVEGVYPTSLPSLHAVVKWDRAPAKELVSSCPGGEGDGGAKPRGASSVVTPGAGLCAFYSIGSSLDSRRSKGALDLRKRNEDSAGVRAGTVERFELAIPNRQSGGRGETKEEEALASSTVALEQHMMEEKRRAAGEMRQVKAEAQRRRQKTRSMSHSMSRSRPTGAATAGNK